MIHHDFAVAGFIAAGTTAVSTTVALSAGYVPSDVVIVGGLAVLASVITALGTAWNARTVARAQAIKIKADADLVAAETKGKLDSIEHTVNSHTSVLEGEIKTLTATNKGLVDQLKLAGKLQSVTEAAPAIPQAGT